MKTQKLYIVAVWSRTISDHLFTPMTNLSSLLSSRNDMVTSSLVECLSSNVYSSYPSQPVASCQLVLKPTLPIHQPWARSKLFHQYINARCVGRRHTTRPGAPTVISYKHDQKVHSWVVSECTGISNVVKVGWKSIPGSWTGVEEATFSKSSVRPLTLISSHMH